MMNRPDPKTFVGLIFKYKSRLQVNTPPVRDSALLMVLCVLLAIGCWSKPAPRNDGKTETDIHILSVAIGVYEMDNHHYPASVGRTQDYEIDADTLYKILSTTNAAGRVYIITGKSTLVDPWGHPFHIWVDGDGDGKVTIKGTVINSPVAIWSDGKNSVNEYGSNDDVTSWLRQ